MSSSATLPPKPNTPPAPDISDLYGDTGNLVAAPPTTSAGQDTAVPANARAQLTNAGAMPPARTTTQAGSADIQKTGAAVQNAIDKPILAAEDSPELQVPVLAGKAVSQYLHAHGHTNAAKAVDAYTGVAEGENDFVTAMSSPKNLAMMYSLGRLKSAGAAGLVLDKLVNAKFSYDSIKAAYEDIPGVRAAFAKGDVEGAARAITGAAGSAVVGATAGDAAMEGTRPDIAGAGVPDEQSTLKIPKTEEAPVTPPSEPIDMSDLGATTVDRRGPIQFGRTKGTSFGDTVNTTFDVLRQHEAARPEPEIKTEGPEWDRTHSAYVDGKKVGSVGYKVDPDGRAQIYGSNVNPEFRGKGIGQKLYQSAIDEAEENGADRITSDSTNTTPDANRVWDKLKEKGVPVEDITHPNGKEGKQITFNSKSVDLSDLGGEEAGKTPDHLLTGERQSALKEPYQIAVKNSDGTPRVEYVNAFSSKDALKQAQKQFPGAVEWWMVSAPGERTPSTEYSVPKGKLLSMPEMKTRTPEETMIHEIGHGLVGQNEGLAQEGILRHTHPGLGRTTRAAVRWPASAIMQNGRVLPKALHPLVNTLMGGIAADEVFNNVPRSANQNFDYSLGRGGDGSQAYGFLRDAGFSHEDALDTMHKAIDKGKEYLSQPHVSDILKENAGVREPNLSKQFHMSGERLSQMHAEAQRRLGNAKVSDNGTTSGSGAKDRAADVAGGEGEAAGTDNKISPANVTTPEVNHEDEGDESFNFGANADNSESKRTATSPESKGTPTNEAAESAQRYNAAKGQPQINHEAPPLNEGRAQALAAEMDTHAHEPNTPAVKKAYKSLIADVKEQWNHAQKDMGIKFEPSEKDPYASYDEVKKDVEDNKHMSIYTGGNPLPEDHPLAQVDPKTGLTYNTMLRGVHDLYGHIAGNNDFSEQGESGATNAHRQMMSPESVPALLNETEGQVSQYFHGKEKGGFPPQNATTVPEHFVQDWHETAGKRAATEEAGGIDPRTGTSAKEGIGSEILPESRKPLDHAPTAQDFKDFYEANKEVLDKNPDLKVGWDNASKEPGGHEINIGIVGKGAARLAAKLDQTAAFDIGKGQVLPTKEGTGLRRDFANYPIEDRVKDAKGEPQSDIPNFERTPQWIYDRMNDDVRAYVKDDPKLQQRIVDAVHNEPLSIDEAVSAASASAKLNGWWRRFNDIFDRIGDAGETKTLKSGANVADFLKALHSALSGNKLVEDANNISFGSFYDWMKEGQPTDRKSIDNIIRNNGKATEGKLGPTGQPKRGNAALSDTIKKGKVTSENLDTTEFYRLVNSPEGKGKKPFGGNIYSETSPIEAIGAEARKLPSMAAVTAGGNLTNAVVDAIMGRFMGRQKPNLMPATEAKYIADTVFLRGAGDKLGLPTSEAQEQIWGTTQAFLTHLKNGLTPEAAADKIMKEGTYHAGKDYADIILNDPEVSGKGGYLDKLKSEFGIGPGSEGIADIHGQTRSAEPPKESAAGRIDQSHLEATGKRILGSLSDKTQARLNAKAAATPAEEPPAPRKKEIPAENPRLTELRAADKAAREARMKKGISGLSKPAK